MNNDENQEIEEELFDNNEDEIEEKLPIEEFKDELMSYINQHQIVICIGETGSGKTTKIPQFFLDSNILQNKMIAITQPRRVAAITVCHRVVDERKSILGNEIGYTVRFDDMTSSKTKVKFMTDGILVRECLNNPMLLQYNAIMLDEAHERSIHTDILFGLVKKACQSRPDLKVLITSATLDIPKFSKYFNNCPIVNVPGRLYPVDIYHSKIRQVMTTSGPSSNAYITNAVKTVLKIHHTQDNGHILLFLTGQEEIEKACEMIRNGVTSSNNHSSSSNNNNNENGNNEDDQWNDHDDNINNNNSHHNSSHRRRVNNFKLLVIPLYASLPQQSQKLAFKSVTANVRKCVVATNIAETSVTVPGVKYVVDPGYIKQKCYDPARRMESLIVVPISQVSAQQRAGRAGRTGPGQCYRLYSQACFSSFCPETIPEIKRCNIANTLLYLKVLGITDVIGFDFMDPPSETQLIEGLVMLHMLGAIDGNGDVTEIGRGMSNFPLEPNLSRMLYEATREENRCIEEIATICAMLSVENIYFYPKRYKSDQLRNEEQRHSNSNTHSNSKNNNKHRNENNNHHHRQHNNSISSRLDTEMERNEVTDAHMRLWKSDGDHFTFLNIYNKWADEGYTLNWCETSFIRFSAMKLAKNIRSQLLDEATNVVGKLSSSSSSSSSSSTKQSNKDSDSRSRNDDDIANSSSSQRKRTRDGNNNEEKPKRTRRDLETAIKRCLVSGLFMNAARRCANETAYRSMPFQLSKDHGLPNEWELQDMLEEVKLLHLHPGCGYGGEIGDRPPEYVVYQDLIHTGRLLMRYLVKVDYEMVESYRRQWRFIHPYRLSNRSIPRPIENIKTTNTSSSSFEQSTLATNNRNNVETKQLTKEEGISAVEAARLRFLARKQTGK